MASNLVVSILQGDDGCLWFATAGGVSRYDGQLFQTLTRQDGLVSNHIRSMVRDREGRIWFSTNSGVTRYRLPRATPPPVFVDAVIADRRYAAETELTIPSSAGLVVFEFHGVSFKDLVYSEQSATLNLIVARDIRDEQIDELETRFRERTRKLSETYRQLQEAQSQLISELEKELQTAHDMQMALMPKAPPRIKGFDIAGRCIPATHVGGDFFQYFHRDSGIAITIADVTGHAMEAAIPVVMFDGILDSQMNIEGNLEDLLARLNSAAYRKLCRRCLVCFPMGELDLGSCTLRLSNAGCPYPYHFRALTGEVTEVQVDAYRCLSSRGSPRYGIRCAGNPIIRRRPDRFLFGRCDRGRS